MRRRPDDVAERRALDRVDEKINSSVAGAPQLPDDVAELLVKLNRAAPVMSEGGARAA